MPNFIWKPAGECDENQSGQQSWSTGLIVLIAFIFVLVVLIAWKILAN